MLPTAHGLPAGHGLPAAHGLQATPAPLVGRADELGRLTGLLADAEAGQPVVVLVSGDAGVGKTRLVTELGTVAADRGFTVLSGRCAELADMVPYLPLADALRDAATGPSARGPVLDALAARPVLSQLLPDRQASQPGGGDLPGLAQQQLFGAVLGMLAELAENGPVLLVLEDMHWADRSTRDLVTFLSRVLHRERIALVATYRTDDMHRRHPLRPVVTELLRLPSVTAIDLRPLDSAAMAEHLTLLSGGLLAWPALDRVISRAEGNAYYAEELLAASSAGAGGSGDAGREAGTGLGGTGLGAGTGLGGGTALPAGLADLLLARMERLSPAAQQVLRAAAVAGRHVDDELVMRASGLAAREYEEAVREAVAHQLLVPDGAHGLAFRHALLREAIYADLLPGERTRLHALLARLLAGERRLAEVAGSAAELAYHALASHDIPGAFVASVLAGEEAERLTAPAEAHRHYDQALSLWDRVSEPAKIGGIERGDLALRSALSAADAGDISRAVQQLRRLLSYLGADADPVLLSRANERLANFLLDIDEDAAALAAATAAVAALPADPPGSERAGALATLAKTLLVQDSGPARAIAEDARAVGRAAGAPWVVADALVTLGQLAERGGRVKTAIASYSRALAQARRAGVLGVELRAVFQLARIHLERGNLAAASGTAHEGILRAEQAGLAMAPYGYDLQYLHYLAHFADGDWDHAQQIADGFAIRVASEAEARLSAMALFIAVARGSDAVEQRRSWLEPFIARDQFVEYIARGLLAEHAYWQGDIEAAAAEAEVTVRAATAWLGTAAPQQIRVAAVWLAALADQAVRARAGGEAGREQAAVAEAGRVIEIARAGAGNRGRPRISLGVDGRGWLARAEAEWRRAKGDNDPAAWQAVLDAFGPNFVYEAARSRWRLAEALAEAGKRDEAQAQWTLAVAAADELGAAPLRRALADLGRRVRLSASAAGRPRGPGSGGRGPLAALTSREVEVLRLLAAGHSNREIAAALFIAPKTASVHVSNILAKLGASSRTEAAAIAHSNGLAPAVS